ncbi:hypothetical protein NIES2130_07415 [Scytonema sp. HK-05]|nr:hypothetical protein NIES2130_07415 [Scytonema sp. HK-05]
MFLRQENLQHLNSIVHEGKVVILATDTNGKIWYTVKQDGFEDSYLKQPADERIGWENWEALELPDEADDQSVIEKETEELTYQTDTSKFIFKSRYQTQDESAVAPVQLISGLGHIYVFRQSKSNTLFVDRFVLDGMTNKLNRKLEVRFKRSKQKHKPISNMNKGVNGILNIDSLDFRDANGNFFYEPTTELCSINNLHQGWFSVVLVPTIENDIYRWHIFAYNSSTQKVELTTIRASEEGLFDVKDYTIFEESDDILVPRRIPGLIRRTLDITGVINGLAATKYDLQKEQQTESGENQLIKTSTRLLLAIPTEKGTAAFSFAIAGDGTLAQIDETPQTTIIRSKQKEVLLPLNTLDEIKAFGDTTPPPQGIITGLAVGTDEEDAEDLVKISTDDKAKELKDGDLVKIAGTSNYQGLYRTQKIDENTFEIELSLDKGLGYWEKEDEEVGGLIFDGMITAYEKTADGKLRVTCPNHGLENGDEVQITGTDVYNDTYPVQKIDDTHFVIQRKWVTREAVNVKLKSQKRRGVVFDGVDDYIQLSQPLPIFSSSFTISMWVKVPHNSDKGILLGDNQLSNSINVNFGIFEGKLRFDWNGELPPDLLGSKDLRDNQWHFISFVRDRENKKISGYIDGVLDFEHSGEISARVAVVAHRIGCDGQKGVANFKGQIANLRIWKIARTAEEIKNSMYLQLTGKEVGLVGYWRLGAIAENKVIDFSVNSNDGIVYGDAYVSAVTLNRKLGDNIIDAVKYSNSELIAISERATYQESFEFKVNSSTPVALDYLNNADGKDIDTKIFTLSYWGKSSRSAEEKKPISAVQNEFEELGNGWYRVSANVTIPDGVSMLRSFEIDNLQGEWESLEIRKHRISLLSDSISEAHYIDSVNLTALADKYESLRQKLQQLEQKEQEEVALIIEKRKLEQQLSALDNLEDTQTKVNKLRNDIYQLEKEQKPHQAEIDNVFNYWCLIINQGKGYAPNVLKVNENKSAVTTQLNNSLSGNVGKIQFSYLESLEDCKKIISSEDCHWRISKIENNYYRLQNRKTNNHLEQDGSKTVVARKNYQPPETEWSSNKWYYDAEWLLDKINKDSCFYRLQNRESNKSLQWGSKSSVTVGNYIGKEEHLWQIISTGQVINQSAISDAQDNLNRIQKEIEQKREELQPLEEVLADGINKQETWNKRLEEVINLLSREVQPKLNELNTSFVNGVKTIEQTPQIMPQVAKDAKGLVTQAALLGFVNPASRLNAIETCEGNVQLSYFDTQGRMRQTNYDATADASNTAFEQWIPNEERVCLNFGNNNSILQLIDDEGQAQSLNLSTDWTIEAWFFYPLPKTEQWNTLIAAKGLNSDGDRHILVNNQKQLGIYLSNDPFEQKFYDSGFNMEVLPNGWHHITAVGRGDTTLFYINGDKVGDTKAKAIADAQANFNKSNNDASAKQKLEDIKKKAILKVTSNIDFIANLETGTQQFGKLAEVRIWGVALTDEEVAVNSKTLLSGNEPDLLAYYPMTEATGETVRDHSGNGNNSTVSGANWWGCAAPIGKPENPPINLQDAVVSSEYSTLTIDPTTKGKLAIMRRFFAYPATDGAVLLPDKRIEALELKWIGNAQFAPTLLGYIEGAPPVPSENLTVEYEPADDYNGATSVELSMSEDVGFSWNRSQDWGLGANRELFVGIDKEGQAGLGATEKIYAVRKGLKSNLDFSYQFQNTSDVTSSSSLGKTDKLELHGDYEQEAKFPHLGKRFIPKNVGYALVASALADVFITRLARTGKMVGQQVQPVDGIPPDVNTITFLINPAYTINGSLDGLTGSSATSDRFFKHVPEMRSQYGSLYPASYYRLQEAYDLKRQIEAEDKRRESYFFNFNVRTLNEISLNRNIDSGEAPAAIGVQREEDKPDTELTEEEKKKAEEEKAKQAQAEAGTAIKESSKAAQQKQKEIESKISDQKKRVQAKESFASWQKRMEAIQIRAGKRNIVNTYVWDADGGLRTEQQSFANTVEHTIGGSFILNAGLGPEGKGVLFGVAAELTAQTTFNLTQTMSKTESRSEGCQLIVDLHGVESRGITDYNDNPILPGEKVDRYRFMSFYLEGSTKNFQDFFGYVVDPEWLASNDEEARALRQAQAGKPNKAWRVLHRVTYVERPALMGFGQNVRKLQAAGESSENQELLDKIAKLEENNRKLEEKLDKVLNLLQQQK